MSEPIPTTVKARPEPLPCGTAAAYHRHRRNGEEACRPCKDAINARNPKSPYGPRVAACGTPAGRERHRRLGETVCEPCRLAYNKYFRDRRASGAGR